jgi:rhodanese-related sulfurtransferase
MKHLVIIWLTCLFAFGCQETRSLPISEFSQEGLSNYTLLDVRTPEEFERGHLENAVNINWFDEDFANKVTIIPPGHTIYVYCQKGGRSAKATALLDSLGYKSIDLTGGYGEYLSDKGN